MPPREARPFTVIVDTREPAMVKQIIQAQLPDEIQLLALPEGDFMLPDRDNCLMGIERKTVSDFLSSLGDGRIGSQIPRMAAGYTIPCLLLEGSYTVTGEGYIRTGGMTTGWSDTALMMALFSMQRQFPDLVVLWSKNLGTTARIIRTLAQRGHKGCFNDTSLFATRPEGEGRASRHTVRSVRADAYYPARRTGITTVRAPESPSRVGRKRRTPQAPGG